MSVVVAVGSVLWQIADKALGGYISLFAEIIERGRQIGHRLQDGMIGVNQQTHRRDGAAGRKVRGRIVGKASSGEDRRSEPVVVADHPLGRGCSCGN